MTGLFVYGTLMPGEPLWPVLAPFAASWARATAAGRLWDTGRGYPAARFDVGHGGPGVVPGVLVAIDPSRLDEGLALLDDVEEVGVLYRRVEVTTSLGPAVTYEWLGATTGMAVLPAGWRRAAEP